MISNAKTSLAEWLIAQDAAADITEILTKVAQITGKIALIIREAPGAGNDGAADSINVQGEVQKTLDIVTHDLMVAGLSLCERVAAMVSEEAADLINNPSCAANADIVACFDPLDGSSNIETNSAIGTIFSLLRVGAKGKEVREKDVLAASGNQVAAGYVLYGPATLLVLTTGRSVALFTLDPKSDEFLLVQDSLSIPRIAAEFAVNMAYQRFWDAELTRYIGDCIAGKTGPRAKDFTMRWIASMVAEVHRIFMRGGIFIYPALDRDGGSEGKLRFLYEANPMAMLVETAGGLALRRDTPLRQFSPKSLHQRTPVVLGSFEEVSLLADLYARSDG